MVKKTILIDSSM